MQRDGIVDFYETDLDDEEYNNDECEYPSDDENPADAQRKKGDRSLLLTLIQLIVCGILIVSAFVISTIGGSIHEAVGTWFFRNYNSSVFIGETAPRQREGDSVKVTENSVPPVQASSDAGAKEKSNAENEPSSGSADRSERV